MASSLFFQPPHVEHPVADVYFGPTPKDGESPVVEPLKFLPLSLHMLAKMRMIAQPMGAAMLALFSDGNSDFGSVQRNLLTEDGTTTAETTVYAIAADLAAERYRQKSEAITSLLGSVMDEKNLHIIGDIILDSLRMYWSHGTPKPPTATFVSSIPLTSLPDLVIGVAKANKGVFGPLAREMGEWTDNLKTMIVNKLQNPASPNQSTSGESSNPSSKTDG